MLVVVQPSSEPSADKWEQKEIEAMRGVAGLYGQTWHTWQVDRVDELALGHSTLMRSLTSRDQIDLDQALADRDRECNVDYKKKAVNGKEAGVKGPGVHHNADFWWRESK